MDADRLGQAARDSQQGAEREQLRVSHGAVDADYVQRLEHFEGWSHESIYAAVREMNPGDMHAAAEAWVSIGNSLSGVAPRLHMQLQSVLTDGSAGRIAEAADRAAREFVQRVLDVAEIAHGTGHRMTAAAFGAEAVRKTVPPPPDTGSTTTGSSLSDTSTTFLGLLLGTTAPGDAQQAEAHREEQYRLALAALEANYVPIYPPAGAGVPAFADVEMPGGGAQSTGVGVDPGSPPTYAATPGGTSPGRTHPGALNLVGDGADPSGTHTASGQPAAESKAGREAAPANGSTDPAATTGSSDDGTTPASTRDFEAAETTPAAGPGTTASPGSPGSPSYPGTQGNPSAPGIGASAAPRISGAPGVSYPGRPTGTPATPIRSTRAARSQSPGSSYPPGMYAPGAHSGTAADTNHTAPSWLTWHRAEELLGTPPPAVPPVLGAEILAARTDLTPEEPETP
ncbi:PPE domain-containing protein [Nocardia inohanensis]|uniref:PPE domain-containing protein n=1 Tax=Nocardia inohanensis TaxID=209246 RepID=UPI000830848D|nr:hypothetical protein [Nocardia inohanensis]